MKTIEDYELAYMNNQTKNNRTCPRCKTNYVFKPDECWFDEKGYGYSTKLTHCKNCGCVNVVKHTEDYGLSKLNTDRRIYFKNK